MGARKNINVNGAATSELTSPATGTVAVAGFSIWTAGGAQRTNYKPLANGTQNLDSGGQLNINDAGVYLTVGTQASDTVDGEHKNVEAIAMLDARYPTGASTDVIKWHTADKNVTTILPAFNVDAYDAAAAWT
jgi:hypothetical protein